MQNSNRILPEDTFAFHERSDYVIVCPFGLGSDLGLQPSQRERLDTRAHLARPAPPLRLSTPLFASPLLRRSTLAPFRIHTWIEAEWRSNKINESPIVGGQERGERSVIHSSRSAAVDHLVYVDLSKQRLMESSSAGFSGLIFRPVFSDDVISVPVG